MEESREERELGRHQKIRGQRTDPLWKQGNDQYLFFLCFRIAQSDKIRKARSNDKGLDYES